MHEIKSPYKHLGNLRVCLPVRVDPQDIAYLRKKFPYGLTGLTDTVLATLFYKFVNELRKHEPFEPSCFVNDPGYDILKSTLDSIFVERCTTGSSDQTSKTSPRDGQRRAGRIRKKMRDTKIERPESSGSSEDRQGAKETKGTE